jgi:molecular chaperone HscB
MPQAFLIQQLEWREALDEARDATGTEAVDALRDQLDGARAGLQQEVEAALDRDDDTALATDRVRQWMFVERFGDDVRSAVRRAGAH